MHVALRPSSHPRPKNGPEVLIDDEKKEKERGEVERRREKE